MQTDTLPRAKKFYSEKICDVQLGELYRAVGHCTRSHKGIHSIPNIPKERFDFTSIKGSATLGNECHLIWQRKMKLKLLADNRYAVHWLRTECNYSSLRRYAFQIATKTVRAKTSFKDVPVFLCVF
jgi:hypothetical protein